MDILIQSFFLWLGIGFEARSSTKAAEFLASTGRKCFEGPFDAPGTEACLPNSTTGKGGFWKSTQCTTYQGEPAEFLGWERALTVVHLSMDHQPTRSTAERLLPASGCQGRLRETVRAGTKSTSGVPPLMIKGIWRGFVFDQSVELILLYCLKDDLLLKQ